MSATPLAGVLVVDLSRHLPGPLAAHLLAGLGARVIKVEEPLHGDPVREAPPHREGHPGGGALSTLLLSGIQSIALDLKQPAAREVLRRLALRADVLLESFRPGTLARLGIDLAELRAAHPRLVVCSLSGWGQAGPWAGRAGHDLSYLATAGTLAGSAKEPRVPAVPVADLVGAWSAVSSILAALVARGTSGEGCRIDAALIDAAAHANLVGWTEEVGGTKKVGEPLPLSGALPCYGVYRTEDGGWLALAALEPHFFARFCAAAGRPELSRLQYRRSPRAHRAVAALVARRTRAEWEEILEREDIPAAPVLSAAEARNQPQMRERALVEDGPDGLPRLGFPALFDGARPRAGTEPPALGAATEAILEELGMADDLPRRKRHAAGIGTPFSWRRSLRRWLRR